MKHLCLVVVALAGTWAAAGNGWAQGVREPGMPSNMINQLRQFDKRDYLVGFWRLAVMSKDYELGEGDRLRIDVFGAPDLSELLESTTIPAGGTIAFPMIGDVKAAGLTAEQLEAAISARLKDQGLMEQPEVLVTVTEYESKPVYVIGEVDNPGQYVMSQPWTLTEAILIAGGVDVSAGRFGYLHHRLAAAAGPVSPPPQKMANPDVPLPGYEVKRIDLLPMREGGILQPDPMLSAGDVVVVPAAKVEMAFVIGDVRNNGGVVLPESGKLPVSRALSVAGPTRTSKMADGILVRYEPNGQRTQIPVDFLAILEGRKPDVEIRSNDVVFIPGSNAKTLGYGLLTSIPRIVENAIIIGVF